MVRDQRRLAAIVSADVVGYSLLMGRNDSATLAGLKAHRQELIDPKIAEYAGRIVKTTGDGLLLEFPSVVDAVRCAVDVQRGMAERNAGVPPNSGSNFASASMLATSSSTVTTSTATASTLPRGCRRWRSRAASASARWCAIRCSTS
jgi:class 3 adenylate cyclase